MRGKRKSGKNAPIQLRRPGIIFPGHPKLPLRSLRLVRPARITPETARMLTSPNGHPKVGNNKIETQNATGQARTRITLQTNHDIGPRPEAGPPEHKLQ